MVFISNSCVEQKLRNNTFNYIQKRSKIIPPSHDVDVVIIVG